MLGSGVSRSGLSCGRLATALAWLATVKLRRFGIDVRALETHHSSLGPCDFFPTTLLCVCALHARMLQRCIAARHSCSDLLLC